MLTILHRNDMNKILKLFLFAVIALSLGACSNEKKDALKKLTENVEKVNQTLPQGDAGLGVSWEKVVLEEPYVVYCYQYGEVPEEDDYVKVLNEIKDKYKTILGSTLSERVADTDDDMKAFCEQVVKAGYGIKYRYVGTISGDTVEIEYTPQEIADIYNEASGATQN